MGILITAPDRTTGAMTTARPRWWREILLLATVYVAYGAVRMLAGGAEDQALRNAGLLLDVERTLQLAPEQAVSAFVTANPILAVPASFAYATLHYLVTPIVLVWLWRARPLIYGYARAALLTVTMLGMIGFWLFPVAPPRMLPGFTDTLAVYAHYGWWAGDASAPEGFGAMTNQFAAMPSLHVAWAAWCGWQIVLAANRRYVQVLGAAYPILTIAVVVGTANHYVADVAAGLALLLAGVLITRLFHWLRPAQPPGIHCVRQ